MGYEEVIQYIGDIPKFTKKHTFEHTLDFIKRLGNPCHSRKILHVAGTNGKGSVCAFMQAILLCEGKSVGFFTSPHLIKLNERIRVNGKDLSDEAFVQVFEEVKAVVDEMLEEGIEHPSYFEFLYGMGMKAFDLAGVEYVILETGLGGRLDATNSFPNPYLSVITSISLDHTEILGDTIEKIASEKAGIIKENVPVFFDGSCEESNVVIEKRAKAKQSFCRKIGNDAFEIKEITDKHIAFSILNDYDKNTVWQIRGTGIYQALNATLAIEAMRYIFGEQKDTRRWQEALANVCWPGRMEEVLPSVILDGAHNLAAIRRFRESIQMQCQKQAHKDKIVVLFSAVVDKDFKKMIEALCLEGEADLYVVTQIEDKRGADVENLAEVFAEYTDKPVVIRPDLGEAFSYAMMEKGEKGKLYCLGSLYLIGELKELIGESYA